MPKKVNTSISKPLVTDVFEAFPHRILLADLAEHFKEVQMHVVSSHLIAAYKEIDRIWEENDFCDQPVEEECNKANKKSA